MVLHPIVTLNSERQPRRSKQWAPDGSLSAFSAGMISRSMENGRCNGLFSGRNKCDYFHTPSNGKLKEGVVN